MRMNKWRHRSIMVAVMARLATVALNPHMPSRNGDVFRFISMGAERQSRAVRDRMISPGSAVMRLTTDVFAS